MSDTGSEPPDEDYAGDGWRLVTDADAVVERWRPTGRDWRAIGVATAMVVVAFGLGLLFIVLVGPDEGPEDRQSPQVEALVDRLAGQVGAGPFELDDLTDFSWTSVGFFGTFNPNATVNNALFEGREEFQATENLTGELEQLLVFADGSALAGWAFVSQAVDGLAVDALIGTVLDRGTAVVEVVDVVDGLALVEAGS